MSVAWMAGRRWVRFLVGLAVGAAAGAAVYGGTRLTGPGLFIVCGAVAGIAATTARSRCF
jgi:hypothetical protein